MTYVTPIPCNLPKATVERIASAVANALELKVGEPLEPIVKSLGGTIVYGGSRIDEIDGGAIIARSFSDFVIYLSQMTSPTRDRFTVAHELGHLFLHAEKTLQSEPGAVMRATRWVDLSDPQQQRAEWEANWFAAGLLMPKEEFLTAIPKGTDYAAAKFNVSTRAIEVRQKAFV